MPTKLCPDCNEIKDWSEFPTRKSGKYAGQPYTYCKKCHTVHCREYMHKKGLSNPMKENKNCTQYLGIYIAERILSKVFKDVIRMPNNNPGFDFICSKGFKVDVKSACLKGDKYKGWTFVIKRNKIADYFLCLAFDDRESLNPMHVWLIPGKEVNMHGFIQITNTEKSINNRSKYEQSINKVMECCNTLRKSE